MNRLRRRLARWTSVGHRRPPGGPPSTVIDRAPRASVPVYDASRLLDPTVIPEGYALVSENGMEPGTWQRQYQTDTPTIGVPEEVTPVISVVQHDLPSSGTFRDAQVVGSASVRGERADLAVVDNVNGVLTDLVRWEEGGQLVEIFSYAVIPRMETLDHEQLLRIGRSLR